MFSKLSSLALVVVSALVVTSSARPMEEVMVSAAPVAHNKGSTLPAPNVITVIDVCVNPNYGNCWYIWSTGVPTGCINLPNLNGASPPLILENSISSAYPYAGIQCTLFSDINCGGYSVRVGGYIPDLSVVGFNDVASSLSCVAN